MKKIAIALLSSVLLACAGNGVGSGEAGTTTQRVLGRVASLDLAALRPWARAGEDPVVGPVFILVSYSGNGCLVSPSEFVQVADNDMVKCRWRRPRPY